MSGHGATETPSRFGSRSPPGQAHRNSRQPHQAHNDEYGYVLVCVVAQRDPIGEAQLDPGDIRASAVNLPPA